jgi:hypothetical protein
MSGPLAVVAVGYSGETLVSLEVLAECPEDAKAVRDLWETFLGRAAWVTLESTERPDEALERLAAARRACPGAEGPFARVPARVDYAELLAAVDVILRSRPAIGLAPTPEVGDPHLMDTTTADTATYLAHRELAALSTGELAGYLAHRVEVEAAERRLVAEHGVASVAGDSSSSAAFRRLAEAAVQSGRGQSVMTPEPVNVCGPAPAAPPLADALAYADDRLARLEHALDLLAEQLEPVLGQSPGPTSPGGPSHPADASEVRIRVAQLGGHADRLADRVFSLKDRLDC